MRGPKAMALAILAFFGCSILAIHLEYQPSTQTAGALGPPEPPVLQPATAAPKIATTEASSELSRAVSLVDLPEPSSPDDLGVAPVPAPLGRERRLNACIERHLGRGYGDVKPTPPGSRPVLRRVLDAQRLRRLEVRKTCERELAPAPGAPAHPVAG